MANWITLGRGALGEVNGDEAVFWYAMDLEVGVLIGTAWRYRANVRNKKVIAVIA
jgi:hypothetical protein